MSDLISRQAAIDAIVNTPSEVQNKNIPLVNQYDEATFRQIEILGIIEALPSAQCERKKGKWINRSLNILYPEWARYTCSVCGEHSNRYDYCPNCGADMRGEQDG